MGDSNKTLPMTLLSVHGIETAYDLRVAHAPTLRAEFGVVIEKTIRELQEIQCIELEEIQPNKQQTTNRFISLIWGHGV
jgi:hypothetical protein